MSANWKNYTAMVVGFLAATATATAVALLFF